MVCSSLGSRGLCATSECIRRVDERDAIERGEPVSIRSRVVAREVKQDSPDLYAGTPPLEALNAKISIAASHKQTF